LRQFGWIEGQNLHIDIRWNAGGAALGQTYAAQLIGLRPEVILAATTKNLEVIREATTTVPVVFVQVSDPIAQRFVASLTKPGGKSYRLQRLRVFDRRQMARPAQGDCARPRPRRRLVQPRHVTAVKIFYAGGRDRGVIPRGAGDGRPSWRRRR